ncbi:MAG TPA: ABC transporter ATP-binding protein [Anaerolineaceae bacterium]|jgi:branched-chain amino acid transport system ATP-binding protein|nr:ABC transporter ATP-binding protein [Anaerolineaceae bacterium]
MRSTLSNEIILKVQDIQSYIGHYHILENVSFEVPKGSIVALLGRNGAGKTTTLKSIMNLVDVREGIILFEDQPIQGLSPYEVAQRDIGYVPEHRAIFRDLSVEENLRIAERKKGDFDAKREMIFELFPDLKKFINLRGTELSGGQQQMLAIARALVPQNRLLLIDEPSEGLAPVIIEQLIEVIAKLAKTSTVILVDQNFLVTSKLADYYVIIEEGKSVEHGVMAELIGDQAKIHRYLGVA